MGGRRAYGELWPSMTPHWVYWRQRFVEVESMKLVMALRRGCWRPKPPCLMDKLAMMWAWVGSEVEFVMLVSMYSVMSLN